MRLAMTVVAGLMSGLVAAPAPATAERPATRPVADWVDILMGAVQAGDHLGALRALDEVRADRREADARKPLLGIVGLGMNVPPVAMAIDVLAELGPPKGKEGEEAIADLLAGEGPAQIVALRWLEGMEAVPASLATALAANLYDPAGSPVRDVVRKHLVRAGKGSKEAAEAAVRGLRGRMPLPRWEACQAIAGIGENAAAAAPDLRALAGDLEQPRGLRMAAALALHRVGGEDKPLLDLAGAALADEDPGVRQMGAHLLGEMGPAAKPMLGTLAARLEDDDRTVRNLAGTAMGKVDRDRAIGLLTELLGARRAEVRSAAAFGLGELHEQAKAAVPALMKLAADESPMCRSEAISALGAMGPAARQALDVIRAALKDDDRETRQTAAVALWLVGGADVAAEAAPPLLAMLRGPREDEQARLLAAEHLAKVQAHVPAVTAELAALVDDPQVGVAAMLALREQGGPAAARAALPKLRKIAEDREAEHRVRWTAARVAHQLESAEAVRGEGP